MFARIEATLESIMINKCGIPSCQNNQKNIILDLNLCLTCSKLLNQTKTVCQFCNSVHDKDHIKVKYEY